MPAAIRASRTALPTTFDAASERVVRGTSRPDELALLDFDRLLVLPIHWIVVVRRLSDRRFGRRAADSAPIPLGPFRTTPASPCEHRLSQPRSRQRSERR